MTFALPTDGDRLADAVIFWTFVCAWVVVLALILFVQLPRAIAQGARLVKRVLALINELPLRSELAKAEADADRLRAALEAIPPLQQRAAVAIATIRSTPLVPPAIGELVVRIRAEMRAFRAERQDAPGVSHSQPNSSAASAARSGSPNA